MTAPPDVRHDPFGRLVGLLVACSFGAVFVVANAGGLPGPWPGVLRGVGIVLAVVLALRAVWEFRTLTRGRRAARAPAGARRGGPFGRGYLVVVGLEVVALFGGLAVINGVLGRTELGVAWVAVVVGVHFLGLAALWRLGLFVPLGVTITVFGVAGFLAAALGASAAVIGLVSGVLSGFALLAAAAVPLPGRARG